MTISDILKIYKSKILAGYDIFLTDSDGYNCIVFSSPDKGKEKIGIQYESGYVFAIYPEDSGFKVTDIQLSHAHNRSLVWEHLKENSVDGLN